MESIAKGGLVRSSLRLSSNGGGFSRDSKISVETYCVLLEVYIIRNGVFGILYYSSRKKDAC